MPGPVSRAAGAAALALASLLAVLAALEGFARLHPPAPDGFGFTRAAERWNTQHWGPLNAAGFRDVEHDPDALRRSVRVVVLGDSFAAGQGIEDPAQRFPDRLRARLGAGWSVVLLAERGWSTREQTRALRGFPLDPHVVVLQYYLNDALPAAEARGVGLTASVRAFGRVRPAWLAPALGASHALDALYWRARLAWGGERLRAAWRDYLETAYGDGPVWEAHRAELRALAEEAHRRGARLVAVVFPNLGDVAGTRDHAGRVAAELRRLGAAVEDLSVPLARWEPAARVAGPRDHHPSAAVHALTAQLLEAAVRDPAAGTGGTSAGTGGTRPSP